MNDLEHGVQHCPNARDRAGTEADANEGRVPENQNWTTLKLPLLKQEGRIHLGVASPRRIGGVGLGMGEDHAIDGCSSVHAHKPDPRENARGREERNHDPVLQFHALIVATSGAAELVRG
jgi:hypothetical protein